MQTLELCRTLVSKFSNIDKLNQYLPSNQENRIDKTNLSTGLSGILVFLSICRNIDLDFNFSELCHLYIEKICQYLKNSHYDLSLHQGLTGVIFSIFLSSNDGKNYQELLSTLESHFRDQITRNLIVPIRKAIENHYFLHPSYLNLSGGISGVISYLMLRDQDKNNRKLLIESIEVLANYLDRQEEEQVPGWFSPTKETLHATEKYKFPQGSFVFSHSYGISGYLAAMISCLERDQSFNYLRKIIKDMSYWIINATERKGNDYFLPIAAATEEVRETKYANQLKRDSWFCGIPSTALTLYRAGVLLEENFLCDFALKAYISLFQKNLKDWNLVATSLFHGRAGIMLVTYLMALISENDFLMDQCLKLEQEVLRYYHPSNEFCFKSVEINEAGNYFWKDDPGLLFGASGIALSLMKVNKMNSSSCWEKILLLN